jgi:2-oxoisovalerate dehydrogenase E1 component
LPVLNDDVRTVLLRRTLAEICGLADGYGSGRGGSTHLRWREAGAMGANAIVGGGVPQAAGFASNQRHAGSNAVTVTYFGDGAVNIGSVLETFNLVAAWRLPLCFFIENTTTPCRPTSKRPPPSPGCPGAAWGSTFRAGGSTA